MRMQDCKQELHSLLTEDVRSMTFLPSECLVYFFAILHGYHVLF